MRKSDPVIRGGEPLRRSLTEKSRRRRGELAAISEIGPGRNRNDLLPKLELVYRKPDQLVAPPRKIHNLDPSHIRYLMHAITTVGFLDPVFIDQDNVVWDGVSRVEAGRQLGLEQIPCIRATHLTATERRVVRLALNRLSEKGQWDLPELKAELIELVELGVEIEDTAFTLAEFDQITIESDIEPAERGPLAPETAAKPSTKPGDVFLFEGGHRIICGDATDPETYAILMQDELARLVFTDEPYNVPIAGHVTRGEHREFAMASGEMSDEEFLDFNRAWIRAALPFLREGGLLGTYIDWRGYPKVHTAATELKLAPINLIVWVKTNAGMGSLYRSSHELFPLFKKGTAPHVNNIELGKHGRWRSNVWTYPGAASLGSDSRRGLQYHPTVKPETMCADAILDLTTRGDIVLDPFLGSGSTLIAAERTCRRCYGIELDPGYVDVVIKRYQAVFGAPATLEETGETFDAATERRRAEG